MRKNKDRYVVDDSNQLIIRRKNFGIPVAGRFLIDTNNRLHYWLNEPNAWRRQHNLPDKVSFSGRWRLNPNHDLELMLDEGRDILVIKGEILSAQDDNLAFEIKSYDRQGLLYLQLLKLKGCWQTDEYNRINFAVKKKTDPNMLTFENTWQINQHQQITYAYEKEELKRKTKHRNTITFCGFWQITSANKLTYILSHSTKSYFDFRVQIETPNLYPKEGILKYRIGIGLKGSRSFQQRVICLYGAWKFSRKLGLVFEMGYEKGRWHNIELGAEVTKSQQDRIVFALNNTAGQPLGLNLSFTHRFLKQLDAQAFVRLKRILNQESAIETGVRIPF